MCSLPRLLTLAVAMTALFAGGCVSENTDSHSGLLPAGNRVSGLTPGPVTSRLSQEDPRPAETPDEGSAEGERLYKQFNCAGCHAAGGGAIGPSLMDDQWVYGGSPKNIFWTIVEGRSQGMPAFGGRISEGQIWKIVAHVRSLSNLNRTETPPAIDPLATDQPETQERTPLVRGRDVFLGGPCALCHTIRGTRALATVGPDLTHLASRKTIAGSLPNTRGNLAGWILNPQNLKVGSQMPPTQLSPDDLHALLAYLESLK